MRSEHDAIAHEYEKAPQSEVDENMASTQSVVARLDYTV
jgi:hypothetical protein